MNPENRSARPFSGPKLIAEILVTLPLLIPLAKVTIANAQDSTDIPSPRPTRTIQPTPTSSPTEHLTPSPAIDGAWSATPYPTQTETPTLSPNIDTGNGIQTLTKSPTLAGLPATGGEPSSNNFDDVAMEIAAAGILFVASGVAYKKASEK